MIRLERNGVTLPLKQAKISLVLQNPMFSEDVIPGIKSFPFEIIRTAESAASLKYPELIGNAELFDDLLEGIRLYFRDTLLFIGALRIMNVNEKSYRVVFYSGTTNLKTLASRKLNALNLGGARTRPNTINAAVTVGLDIDGTDYQLPSTRNPGLYGDEIFQTAIGQTITCEYFNYVFAAGGFATGGITPVSGPSGYDNFRTMFLPFPYFLYVFKQIFNENGIAAEGTVWNDEWLKKLIITNQNPFDADSPAAPSYFPDYPLTDLFLSRHVPDIEIGEFLREARRMFNLCFDYSLNSDRIRISPFRDLYNKVPDKDWSSKILKGSSIDFSLDEAKYEFFIPQDAADQEPVDPNDLLRVYINKGGGTSVSIGRYCSVVLEACDVEVRDWAIPKFNQIGNSAIDPRDGSVLENNPFDLRMLFYLGMRNDSNGIPYPMANTRNVDEVSSTILPGGFSLRDAESMYETWWADYVNMVRFARNIPRTFKLELEDLLNFSFHDKLHIDDQNYFIKKMNLDIGEKIYPADAELIRV